MMDHRCLYGHRTPASFAFAIDSASCPVCGAPLVSVVGYQIARKLASSVPLDPVDAFNTVRALEKDYELVPRSQTEDEAEVSMAEIEIDESEVESTNTEVEVQAPVEPVVAAPVKAKKSKKARSGNTAVPVDTAPPVEEVEVPQADVAPPPVVTEAAVEDSLSDVEKDFFASGEVA